MVSGGHPQTPAKGLRPLDARSGECCLKDGWDHPLAPFLPGRGQVRRSRLWRHILHTACQWGCTPLDSPLAGPAPLRPYSRGGALRASRNAREVTATKAAVSTPAAPSVHRMPSASAAALIGSVLMGISPKVVK